MGPLLSAGLLRAANNENKQVTPWICAGCADGRDQAVASECQPSSLVQGAQAAARVFQHLQVPVQSEASAVIFAASPFNVDSTPVSRSSLGNTGKQSRNPRRL